MKAYLVRNRAAVSPFAKPASQVRFHRCTVESRLRAQLAKAGFEVVELDAFRPSLAEPGSIAVQDDVVVSDTFFRRFLSSIPNRKKSYQLEIDARHNALFSSKSAAANFKLLPLHYYGEDKSDPIPHRMAPDTLHAIDQGLPARMHMLTDMCVYFLDYYAHQIEYWFDLQIATSLYCREFVADSLRPLKAMLPPWLVTKIANSPWIGEKINSIGKNTRIHRTAILEGSVIGDNVEIGPFSYVRSAVIGDGAVLREKSSVKASFIGAGGFLMGSDVVNSYVGAETAIISPMLYHVVFGERGLLSGGSGFADFIVGSGSVPARIDGKDVPSNLSFLASGVGDDCFLGANLVFAPGRTIPDGTRLLDHGLIKSVPTTGGAYVLSGTQLLQIPEGFMGKVRQ